MRFWLKVVNPNKPNGTPKKLPKIFLIICIKFAEIFHFSCIPHFLSMCTHFHMYTCRFILRIQQIRTAKFS
jgi:hypothetical protein